MRKLAVVPVAVLFACGGSVEPDTSTSSVALYSRDDRFSTNGCQSAECLSPDNLQAIDDARYADVSSLAQHYLRVCANLYGVVLVEGVPMDDVTKRHMAGCGVAHINAYGVHVLFNGRAEVFGEASLVAQQTFGFHEAAFRGEYKVDTAAACGGCAPDSVDIAYRRVCGDGQCGDVRLMGACHDVCKDLPDHGDAYCEGDHSISAHLLAQDGAYMNCLGRGKCSVAEHVEQCQAEGEKAGGVGHVVIADGEPTCMVCGPNQTIGAVVTEEGVTASCTDLLTVGGESGE